MFWTLNKKAHEGAQPNFIAFSCLAPPGGAIRAGSKETRVTWFPDSLVLLVCLGSYQKFPANGFDR